MLMVMPVQALIRNRIPASTQLPKFQVFIDFNCAANLSGRLREYLKAEKAKVCSGSKAQAQHSQLKQV